MNAANELHVVFGASGGLGSAVVRELVAQGKRIRAVNRSGKGQADEGVQWQRADALDAQGALQACENAAVIYHCMAPPYHRWPQMAPPAMRHLIDAAAATGAKLVYGDNLYMYGPVDGPLDEDLPNRATDRKGKVRAQVADMLMDAHASGRVRATIGRGADFYGPGVLNSALGERVFKPAVSGGAASLLVNIDTPHTYTFIEDFARALVTLAEKDAALGEIWHAPNPEPLTTRKILEMIFNEVGNSAKIRVAPRPMVAILALFNPIVREVKDMLYQWEQPYLVDHSKYEGAFGANPTPHAEGIRRTVAWYRQHMAGQHS